MQDFLSTFLAFNQNAFFETCYFVAHNIFAILGLASIGYLVFCDIFSTDENAVKDERQII